MGIVTVDEAANFERGHALNNAIDHLIELLQHLRIYNESAVTVPGDMDEASFKALCVLLNQLADVENWSSPLSAFEDLHPSLVSALDNLAYEVTEVLESFGVNELCKDGRGAGEFWFDEETEEPVAIFGGRWNEGGRWVVVRDPQRHPFARKRVRLFDDVEQFTSIDDAPFLEVLHDMLSVWRASPTDRAWLTIEDPAKAKVETSTVFIPTPLQSAILRALDGKSLKKQALADIVAKGEGSRLYRARGIKELMQIGKVKHSRGRGYYRSDAPPSDAEVVRSSESPQKSPKESPSPTACNSSPQLGD